jgi:hypothetical protein
VVVPGATGQLLLVLLAVAVGCALIATGRFGGRAGWSAAGLAITLPDGFLQAYVLARRYTLANGVPGSHRRRPVGMFLWQQGKARLRLRLAQRFTYAMPVWGGDLPDRPSKPVVVPVPISIRRVEGT